MATAVVPNWLTVIGLIYCLYGLIILADGLLAGRLAMVDDIRRLEAAQGYRSVAIPLAASVLGLGFLAQIAGQFLSMPFSAPVGLALLALAFVLIIHTLVSDSARTRVVNAVATSVSDTGPVTPTVRLRAAS